MWRNEVNLVESHDLFVMIFLSFYFILMSSWTGTIMVVVPNQHRYNCIQTDKNRHLAGEYHRDYRVPCASNQCQEYFDTHRTPMQRDPDKFNGQTVEWSDYLIHFETVTNWNGWNDFEKASQLIMSLQGEAQRVFSDISPCINTQDYGALLTEL